MAPQDEGLVALGDLDAGQSRTLENEVSADYYGADIEMTWNVSATTTTNDPDDGNDNRVGSVVVQRLAAPNSSGGCFVATAAYGSYLEGEVVTLRRFRDDYLLTNPLGRILVSWYYEVSPPLAAWIADRTWARLTSRALLTPIVYSVRYPELLAVLLLLLAWRRYRRFACAHHSATQLRSLSRFAEQ